MLDWLMRKRFWIVLAVVIITAVMVGVLYGYVAGLAVVFAVATVSLFYLWGATGLRSGG